VQSISNIYIVYLSQYRKTPSSISIHSLICFAPSGDHSPSAPETISKNCAKMLPQPGLLLWNCCPQRCRQVQWQGELVWLTWQQLGSRQIELGVGFGCKRCMKIKHWQSPALQKFYEILPQTQNAPNRHSGLCRTKLDKCLGRQTCNMQHATISATWICRPVMFTKQKDTKSVKMSHANRAFVYPTWRDPMPPTIPLCGRSWTWHGDGRERIRGLSHRADG
jgi:hypothetical protein